MLNLASGLKIPTTSILQKGFMLLPLDYLTTSGSSIGVMKEVYNPDENISKYEFTSVTVYKRDEENQIAYMESDLLVEGDYIRSADTKKRYQVGQVGTLEGVYNVNNGYALFRVINKIYENKEYVIVEEGTPYGLSVYDRIVVNADTIGELQIIGK